MCGITGYYQINGHQPPDYLLIGRMMAALHHRGPDEFGAYVDAKCVLGQARLSIIDLVCGSQPLSNEDGTLWITYNGEIFNYIELRSELERLGHRFHTRSDTEVIIHAFEQWGEECLHRFNGQFAFCIYDCRDESLFIARDRLGKRPVFYTTHNGRFLFASEIKAIFADPSIPRHIDLKGLDEIFTWWTTAPPRTAFEGINELEAGTFLRIKRGEVIQHRYWQMSFPESYDRERSAQSWAEELYELLTDAVRLRLRADVPVGAYLSGGLDSSAVTALIHRIAPHRLETFSIGFQDEAYDESAYQAQVADALRASHHQILCSQQDIAENFDKVIWHTERPIVRTAPTPLYLLAKLVRDNNLKVVLTGEGADEIFGGYDLFKEVLIRTFWARRPESSWRAALLQRLYPTLPLSPARAKFFLEEFYRAGLTDTGVYYYSHAQRLQTTSKVKGFFTPDVRHQLEDYDSRDAFAPGLPDNFFRWHHLARAQFLEARSLLSGYLLSSQGDRMTAAHGVEGRYPFLDHRLVEFAATIPPGLKIRGLDEKFILKKAMARDLPKAIVQRVKQPYMAPDANCFVQEKAPSYVPELLSEAALRRSGLFEPVLVNRLRAKCAALSQAHMSFKDNMSFVGILSTQLLVSQFIDGFSVPEPVRPHQCKVWQDRTHAASRKVDT